MPYQLPKTLQRVVERNDKLESGYSDGDGHWILCKPGFIGPMETHELHEWNVRDMMAQIKDIQPCFYGDECDDCNERKTQ